MAPDRTSLRSGAGGLALAGLSAVPWGRVTAPLYHGPAHPAWDWTVFAAISVAGFCLGVFAIWSAIKAWLRHDFMTPEARWGITLGAAACLAVVAIGPCGPASCPS
jgi:hypothetical protein